MTIRILAILAFAACIAYVGLNAIDSVVPSIDSYHNALEQAGDL